MTSTGELGSVETPAALAPATAKRVRRRRRPSGEPPPLPKRIGTTGKVWLGVLIALVAIVIASAVFRPVRLAVEWTDAGVLRQMARLRTEWLTDVMTAVDRAATGWSLTVVWLATLAAMLFFRRWRHLFTFIASVVVFQFVGVFMYEQFARPRPYDVTIIGRWAGFSMPSPPVAVLASLLMAVLYAVVVPGRPRNIAKIVVGGVLGLLAFARLYLGVDHPSDILVGAALGIALPLAGFRMFTPNDVFPVAYRKGKTAHLDVGGARGDAIRRAVQDQLGLTVLDIKPVGLEGSAGSTPLRLRVAGDPDTYLFGKLYAMNHVRADRWYKLGRTILYGRLEDEAPYQTVRRLVEYEDYALRLMRDIGVHTAAPYGIVELTPEREYMLLNEFFDGAHEIGDPRIVVDDNVIDEGLLIVRRLWDAGVAHRDIKPANLMVRDGHVLVIDTAFAQVRPSPWRQAVDLANMMLVLAVRTDAERVYQRALQFFTPDDIAEAFAAARSVASPTQLRTAMKRDGRNLVGQFRALAPPRRPISLQRWSVRRVLLAAAILFGAFVVIPNATALYVPAHDLGVHKTPDCGTSNVMILMAQAVPSATALPCLANVPAGWELGDVSIERNRGRFALDSAVAGNDAVVVTLLPPDECDTTGAMQVPSDEAGTRRFERPEQVRPSVQGTRYYLLEGGCVTYRFELDEAATPAVIFEANNAIAFQARDELVEKVRDDSDRRLCGAAVPCPGGS